ncbi:MAG: hypothetical protein FD119_2830 [Stygiobacter sp.]|nr:MAG: hypothetical protein FD119_2830 [Stygiobacter sp.]
MDRLLNAQIRFSQKSPTGGFLRWINMPVTEIGELWWKTPESPQGCLFQSYIVLSEGFFRLVTDKPFPLDRRALTALKQSPLALDLYAWTVCRSYGLKKGVPVSWQALKEQLGADYADLANFGREVRETLKKVKSVFPGLNYQCAPGRVVLLPGYPAVPKKNPVDKVLIHGEMIHPVPANDSAAFNKTATVKRYKRGR